MTETELVETAFAALLRAAEHEIRDRFTYYGRRIFSPHIPTYLLIDAVDTAMEQGGFDKRKPAVP